MNSVHLSHCESRYLISNSMLIMYKTRKYTKLDVSISNYPFVFGPEICTSKSTTQLKGEKFWMAKRNAFLLQSGKEQTVKRKMTKEKLSCVLTTTSFFSDRFILGYKLRIWKLISLKLFILR